MVSLSNHSLHCTGPLPTDGIHPENANRRGERGYVLDEKAFTLIEMVVVTALISILLVVAIPRLDGGFFSDDADDTSKWIIANVRHLKEKAVNDQRIYFLNVSFDAQRLWVTHAEASETEMDTALEEGHAVPNDIAMDHVAHSETQRFSSGTVPIAFYPQGYSDKAVIRMKTNDGERLAFFIEPFLPAVRLVRGSRAW